MTWFKRICSGALALALTFALFPTTAYAASAASILNGAVLSPDHFLAEGSNDYLLEYTYGADYQYFLDTEFEPEDADALICSVIQQQTNSSMTTFQKVKALYDYMINITDYGYGGFGNYCSVYSVLVNHIGTCVDYNYVMMAFLRYLGIDASLVYGQTHASSGGYTGHAWVEAYINGVTYVFDPQIDDNIAKGGTIGYYRFCKTYSEVPDKYILDDMEYIVYFASPYDETLSALTTVTYASGVTLQSTDFSQHTAETEGISLSEYGCCFTGWYYDENTTQPVNTSTPLRRDMIVWAGYGVRTFTDTRIDAWYSDAVAFAYDNGLMNGISSTQFAPTQSLTRGMMVQILYNLEEQPAADASPFTDAQNAWYSNAVGWAYQNGIVNGTTSTTFAPNNNITREQMATILYKYATSTQLDTSASTSLSSFTDASSVSSYAKDALSWAVAEGLINGMGDGTLNPKGNATRAQVASILQRFITSYYNMY